MDYFSISSDIINMNYDELVLTGQRAVTDVFAAVSRISKETDIKISDPYHISAIFLVALSAKVAIADNKFTALEKQYIKDVIKIPAEDFIREMQSDFEDAKEYIPLILSRMSCDEKKSVATVILTLSAVDNEITYDEIECLNKIVG